jgi:putative DNA primase/helicase
MNATELAKALGGTREGRAWRCPCPVHGGRSLIVAERGGKTLFNCKAGCAQDAVLEALCNLGVFGKANIDGARVEAAERRRREDAARVTEIEHLRRRIDAARSLYRRAIPAAGTPAEAYLRSRGITLPMPECLRFLPHCPHRADKGYARDYYPALIAPVVGVTGHLIGVHKTFLRPDGSGKADLPDKSLQRECCGIVSGGAVRLAMPVAGKQLIGAEGIETSLSAMQLFELPAWAALSAPGLAALELPPAVRAALICAAHDHNAVGLQAALDAKKRWNSEGRTVLVRWPRQVGSDFNDILRSGWK